VAGWREAPVVEAPIVPVAASVVQRHSPCVRWRLALAAVASHGRRAARLAGELESHHVVRFRHGLLARPAPPDQVEPLAGPAPPALALVHPVVVEEHEDGVPVS